MAATDAPVRTLAPSTLTALSDETLAGLVAAGSDDAFAVLDARYRRRLQRFVRGFVTSTADAEDVAQDALLRALRALRGGRSDPDALGPWLHRIARNRAVDLAASRRRAPTVELADGDAVQSVGEDVHAALERRQRVRQVMHDVTGLPDTQRSALVLRELEGRSYVDIADELDVTVGAVKSLLVRARAGLRRAGERRAAAVLPLPFLGRLVERLGTVWEPVTAVATPKVACVAVVAVGSLPILAQPQAPPPTRERPPVVERQVRVPDPAAPPAAVTAGPIAETATESSVRDQVLTDCADGTIDGEFSLTALLGARSELGSDGREYDAAGCGDAIRDALVTARTGAARARNK